MTKIDDIDRDQALKNPEAEFDKPSDVVDSSLLTRGEKLKALSQWEFAVRRRLDSLSEGMAPPSSASEVSGKTADPATVDADLLRQIELCTESVKNREADGEAQPD